jgi:hypothetical protein
VLHWRLRQLADNSGPIRTTGPLPSLPALDRDDEHLALARAAGELMRQR